MPWMKVDDRFHSSEKLNSIPKRQRFGAAGLWTVAGSWVAGEETDGFVPDYMIRLWNPPVSLVESLVNAGLWERESDGYRFVSWLKYNPSKEDSDAKRAASAERMARSRERRKKERAGSRSGEENVALQQGSDVAVQQERLLQGDVADVLQRPDPTRPDPTHKEVKDKPTTEVVETTPKRKRHTYPPEFEEWWKLYPRPAGKPDALKAWKQADIDPDELAAHTQALADAHKRAGTDKQYIPHPATWLRREGWNDELPTPPQAKQKPRTDLDDYLDTFMGIEPPQQQPPLDTLPVIDHTKDEPPF